jgi:cortexillin 1/2
MQDQNLSPAELEKRLKEKKWEEVQKKGLSAWVNSYLAKAGLPTITTLPDDLTDGVKLLQFLELATDKPGVFGNYRKEPTRIQKMENCSLALKYIKNDLNIRLVGIGAEDIVDGNLTLVLGLLWSSFRKLSLGSLSDRESSAEEKGKRGKPEDDLIKWISELVSEDYGLRVVNFKESFNDGLVWAALIDRFDPEFLDFHSLDRSNPEQTLNLVFDVAEKKLGIPKLFDASEMLSGNPDERSVVLYSSLFYHAWTSNQDRIKLANEKRGLGSKMSDLKLKLQQEEEERQRLQAQRDEMLSAKAKKELEVSEEDKKLRELQAAIQQLQEEKEKVSKLLKEAVESRQAQFADDVEKMKTRDAKWKKKLEEEREKGREAGKENTELLAENYELLETLRRRLGLKQGESLGFDVFANSKAGLLDSGSGMNNLSALLREHVNALHLQFKEMQDREDDISEKNNILEERREVTNQVKAHVSHVLGSSNVDESRTYLADVFAKENASTLSRVFGIKDVVNELREVVDKRGYLLAQVEGRRWKKRWFVLRGFILYYYNKKEDQDDISSSEGELSLEFCSISALELEGKPTWAIKLTVSEEAESSREELVVGAKTQEERDDWFYFLQSKILYSRYLALSKRFKVRPDTRIINLFNSRKISAINLDELDLSVELLKLLGELFEIHKEPERVSLAGTQLDDARIALISSFLTEMPHLVSLNLSRNKFTSKGLGILAQVLTNHKQMKRLDLSHNEIDDAGFSLLVPVLASNENLEEVNLSHNRISGESVTDALRALGGLKSLSALKLHRNAMGDAAAIEISRILTSHPAIVSVKLQGNKIGDQGAAAIFDSLKTNSSVTNLDLSNNAIGTQGLKHLKELFETNQIVRKVELSGNNNLIGGGDLKELLELSDIEVPNFSLYRTG